MQALAEPVVILRPPGDLYRKLRAFRHFFGQSEEKLIVFQFQSISQCVGILLQRAQPGDGLFGVARLPLIIKVGAELLVRHLPQPPIIFRAHLAAVVPVSVEGEGGAVLQFRHQGVQRGKALLIGAGKPAQTFQAAGQLVQLAGIQLPFAGCGIVPNGGGNNGVFGKIIAGSERVGEEDNRHHGAEHQRPRHGPEGRLFVMERRLHTGFDTHFAEGQRACAQRPAAGAAFQQGLGVVRPLAGAHAPHHPLVAGQLDVPAEQNVGRPQKGIEPIDRQQHKSKRLPPVVPAGDVRLFMGDDRAAGLRGQGRGKIDAGTDQPEHKGGGHPVTFKNVVPHRHGLGHPAAQPQPADKGV